MSILFIDPIPENGEVENHRPTVDLENQIDPIVNHIHEDEQSSNGIDSTNELIEAQKQILLLREDLNDINGKFRSFFLIKTQSSLLFFFRTISFD
jgi:hypothetical protein